MESSLPAQLLHLEGADSAPASALRRSWPFNQSQPGAEEQTQRQR